MNYLCQCLAYIPSPGSGFLTRILTPSDFIGSQLRNFRNALLLAPDSEFFGAPEIFHDTGIGNYFA